MALTGVVGTVASTLQQVSGISTNWAGFGLTTATGLLAFVGFVLFFVAMYGFSKDYAERRIFMYIIYGIVIAIVSGIIIGVAWFGFTMFSLLSQLSSVGSISSSAEIQAMLTPYTAILLPTMAGVMFVVLFFIYKSYNLLAQKSSVTLFSSAAKIFVLAAIVNIIIGAAFAALAYTSSIDYRTLMLGFTPGAFIQYIAWAFAAKGFFAIQSPVSQRTAVQLYPATNHTLYCPNCGAQTQLHDVYCAQCGKKL